MPFFAEKLNGNRSEPAWFFVKQKQFMQQEAGEE